MPAPFWRSRSPGKVLRPSPQDFTGLETCRLSRGQEDIKLVVEPAGSIEGKIVCAETNQPLPIARLTLQPDQPGCFMRGER